MAPNPSVDRLKPGMGSDSPLSKWATLYGLMDVWRWKYPHDRAFTCQSASYRTLSRIDLIYITGGLLSRVIEVKMLPRGISDHSPMLLTLQTQTPSQRDYGGCPVIGSQKKVLRQV